MLRILLAFITVTLIVGALVVLPLSWVGTTAQNKGREPIPWIGLSLFITPLGALILLWLLPPADGFGSGPPTSPA